ncbi:MAG: hypothetical protein FJX04_09740 [Alphaproteobacteria bacterium]|nr:hypothetical protein [Alphaproteobacteria bacterium]
MAAGEIDAPSLRDFTNAAWLVRDNLDHADHGLFLIGEDGQPLVWDGVRKAPASSADVIESRSLMGRYVLPDGTKAATSLHLIAERYLDQSVILINHGRQKR